MNLRGLESLWDIRRDCCHHFVSEQGFGRDGIWLSSDDEAVRAIIIGYMFHDQIRYQRCGAWYRSAVSHITVRDLSHCWRKNLVWVYWIYCHLRKQHSQGCHYLSDTVLRKTPSNGIHLSRRICWIPRINCADIWTSPHCRRHEYSCGRPR